MSNNITNMNNPIIIFEVSPRDGLQNEKKFIPTNDKINLIKKLIDTGIDHIELTSFVSSKAIPQFIDAEEVVSNIVAYVEENNLNINLSVLVPNEKGMLLAIKHKIKEIAIFTSVSDEFNKKNINCNIDESFLRFVVNAKTP